jgi:hypothetical protein
MKIGVAKERAPNERRVALVPDVLSKLTAAGAEMLVERGAGEAAAFPDTLYEAAGAKIVSQDDLFAQSDVVLTVQRPQPAELGKLRKGQGACRPAAATSRSAGHGDAGQGWRHCHQPRRVAPDACRGHSRWTRSLHRPTWAATVRCSSRPKPTAATSHS